MIYYAHVTITLQTKKDKDTVNQTLITVVAKNKEKLNQFIRLNFDSVCLSSELFPDFCCDTQVSVYQQKANKFSHPELQEVISVMDDVMLLFNHLECDELVKHLRVSCGLPEHSQEKEIECHPTPA